MSSFILPIWNRAWCTQTFPMVTDLWLIVFRMRENSLLSGDNWFLRRSPSLSNAGSYFSPDLVNQPHKQSSSLSRVPVTVPPPVTRAQIEHHPDQARPTEDSTFNNLPSSRDIRRNTESAPHHPPTNKPDYDRQISRVRSISVFSTESHIHRDEDQDDDLSIDFDILESGEVRMWWRHSWKVPVSLIIFFWQ